MKQKKQKTDNVIGGEKFINGRCKLSYRSKGKLFSIKLTKYQALKIMEYDNEKNFPVSEGW